MRRSVNRISTRSLLGLAYLLTISLLAAVSPVSLASAAVVTDRPLLFSFDGNDTTAGHFLAPWRIAIDNSNGYVYVSEKHEGEGAEQEIGISRFHFDGTPAAFSATGTSSILGLPGGAFSNRIGIAVDNSGGPRDGWFYVSQFGQSTLYAFDPAGNSIWTRPPASGQPEDVALDTSGHLWDSQGREYANTGSPPAPIFSLGASGSAIDIDANDNVYLADSSGVRKYVGGALDSVLDPAATSDVYADQSSPSGHVFTAHAESFNEYDSSGSLVGTFGTGGAVDSAGTIAYDPSTNRVYVGDRGLNTVDVFGPSVTGTVPDPAIETTVTSGPGTATFHGTVNPQGVANAYYFEWAKGSSWENVSRSPLQSLPEDSSSHPVEFKATNLFGNEDQQVRLVAVNTSNDLRSASGVDTFKPPKAAAGPAVAINTPSVTATTAHITGTINPKEDSVRWRVETSTDPACASSFSGEVAQYLPGGEINTPQNVEYDLTGLQPTQHYCVRFAAHNSFEQFGTGSVTEIKQFNTPALSPSEVSTAFAAPRTDTTARINGRLNPNGSADFKYQFEWSEDGSSWTQLPLRESSIDATEPIVVSDELTGLKPNTTYHYRLAFAENETPPATLGGAEKTFTTRTTAEMELPARGIEMVNNPDTGNQNVYLPFERHIPYMSADGNKVLWAVTGGAPGSFSGVFAQFLAERTPGGWQSRNVAPPAQQQLGEGGMRYDLDAASPELSHFVSRVREAAYTVSQETLARLDDHQNQDVLKAFSWVEGEEGFAYAGIDMTSDGAHVLAIDPETRQLVDVGSGSPEVVSMMPDGTPSSCGLNPEKDPGFIGYITGVAPQWRIGYHMIATTDASLAYFRAKPNGECAAPLGLYVRDRESEETTLIAPGTEGDDVEFIRASPDGRIAYFLSTGQLVPTDTNIDLDLYRWDQDTGESSCLTCVVGDADIAGSGGRSSPVIVSDDFSHAYFQSTKRLIPGEGIAGRQNVYALSGGAIRFVATLNDETLAKEGAVLSADGNALVFSASGNPRLTADAVSCVEEGCEQLYLYDDHDGSLECLSCLHGGVTARGLPPNSHLSGGFEISADGSTVAFATAGGLVPRDVNHAIDIYQWRGGSLQLLTDGVSETEGGTFASPGVWGMDADGSNILFSVAQPGLTGFEQDRMRNVYDARIGGGFEPPGPPIHCSGDSCQGPLVPAPEAGHTASSAFSGYGNQKSSAKPRKNPCAKKRGKAKQRCVRKHKRHSQKARANDSAGRTK